MAIVFRAGSAGPNNNATSTTISLPTGTTTGDVTIAAFIQAQTAYTTALSLAPPSGWNVLVNMGGVLVCWRAWQSGDPTSITANSSASLWWESLCVSYSGLDTAAPIDASSGHYAFSQAGAGTIQSSRYRAPSLNPRFNGSCLLSIFGVGSTSGATLGLPAGMTARAITSSGPSLRMCDKSLTDGTPTGNLLSSGPSNYCLHFGAQIALKAAGATAATLADPAPVLAGMVNCTNNVNAYTLPLDLLNVQDGDMVLFFAANASGSVSSAPVGYTSQSNISSAVMYSRVWKTGDATSPVFTFSDTNYRNMDVWLMRKTGASALPLSVDQVAVNTTTASAAVTSATPSLTPAVANEILIALFGVAGSPGPGSWSAVTAGLTDEDVDSNGPGIRLGWAAAASPTGAFSATWSRAGNNTLSALAALIRVGGGGGGVSARPQVFICT
jgi:hypothetical protein